jgi:hypothetical protein
MNWMPESIESGMGKSGMALYPTPGLKPVYILGNDPIRGEISFNGRAWAISGTTLYELKVGGVKVPYVGLVNDGQSVSMVVGGAPGASQLLIASGGNGYVFDLQALTLVQVPPAMQAGPWATVHFIDGFFIAVIKNSNEFQLSDLEDATNWNLGNVSQVSLFADNVVSSLADHRELWLWGGTRSIVLYNSGDLLNPVQPVPGAFLEQGSIATLGAARIDNSVFWLGGDERGAGIAWRAQGYSPQRISNHAVEYAWQQYPTMTDAIAYAYQDAGHTFYVLTFPSADATWVYDVSTGMWHQRGFWNANSGKFTAHRARFHTYNFGMHLVGDYTVGRIYSMSTNVYNDLDGFPIRRIRRAPHISSEQEWIFHHQLQVDFETGLGPQPPLQGFTVSPTTFTLADSGANLWQITVDDTGNLHSAATVTGPAQTIILNDGSNTISWQLGVTLAGLLTTTAIALGANPPQLQMNSSTGLTVWVLGVTTPGLLTTTQNLQALARDPVATLSWSDDGGHAWSNKYDVDCGQAGQYKKRAIWRRLGRSRDRVYQLEASDPIPWRVVDAYLMASPGFTPTERISKQLAKGA